MSTLTADRIRSHATRLGLTHLTDILTELVERAETGQMGYLDFVDLLLEEEVGLREGRPFRNALKLSGLPHHKTGSSQLSMVVVIRGMRGCRMRRAGSGVGNDQNL